ncbi:MAG: CRISPR-associated protein Cas4 [Spirochaetes bacterium]|jgi:CRISPR-associated exonuclease Cas4|nr:CRISPR-associated protein Cas4 [Spirochaetota bacterium]
MYSEDDYIQLSAIQHYIFCKRQCALIHVAGLWQENVFTTRGELFHENADSGKIERRINKYTLRSIYISSERLGLSGKADIVEITKSDGAYKMYPVEYKVGKQKLDNCDAAQLMAQALCLEEMMGCSIDFGALFYGKERRRTEIPFTEELRNQTEEVIYAIHDMVKNQIIPDPVYSNKCKSCSLNSQCMPKISHKKIQNYITELYSIT